MANQNFKKYLTYITNKKECFIEIALKSRSLPNPELQNEGVAVVDFIFLMYFLSFRLKICV